MDRAKQQGGDRCERYAASLDTGSADTLTLEAELRYAIDRQELEVHYQPKVSLETGKIIGAEALLRWYHPERGAISPAQFIPVAEESGLVQVLGEWVLETACRQTRAWQQAGLGQLRVAVNLSARQFEQPDLPERLLRVLHETGLEPQWLELELTESMLVRDVEAAIRRLRTLKALGVSVAIDDFGTGYSSLSYLQQFPFDILKIDRAFVRNLSVDAKNQAIATAILQMARQLELTTVAEGVEEAIELEFLRQRRCDEMQGYFFSRPLPSSEFERSIQTGKSLNFDAIANSIG
jgi:EAL domain-containing protein (putative c-di-GMP-specific phosphodiesterase class I)